jgi:Domain of unknown function (DUF4340)
LKRSTVVAALVLAALGAYIYWFERAPKEDGEGEALFNVQKDAIDRIELRARGKEPVVVEKKDASWFLTAPVAAKADASEVDLLLQNLSTLRFDRVVAKASTAALPDFGLDSPPLGVRFHTRDGKDRSLDFGKDAPTESHQYARRDGADEILVLRSHLSLNFDKSGWDLREKAVFPGAQGSESEPRRIQISRPSGTLLLVNEGGLWRVTEPLRARADRYRVSSLVSRMRSAKMRDVVSETPDATPPGTGTGLEEPERRIRIEPPEGSDSNESLELSIGSKKGDDFYAKTPSRPQVFLVASDLVEELDRPVSEYESMKLFEFSTFDAGRFRIEARAGSGSASEVRDVASKKSDSGGEKTWRETSPAPGRDLDTAAVEDFLYKLNGTSAAKIVERPDLAKLGLEAPAFVVSVWSKEPEVEENVQVSKPLEGSVYALRKGDEVALELTTETWQGIEALMTLEPKKPKETEESQEKKEPPPNSKKN